MNLNILSPNNFTNSNLIKSVKDNDDIDKKNQIFFKRKDFLWFNAIYLSFIHIGAFYGILTFPYFQKKLTFLWFVIMICISCLGITAGAHRLWSHRSYKAKTPLRIILIIFYLSSGQYSMKQWTRDHRLHHKYADTDADPHNSNRGFWFSHVGWLVLKTHPDGKEKLQQIDISDVLDDPVVAFEERYFWTLQIIICFILPSLVPVYLWNETLYYSIISQAFMRYVFSLNFTWTVNSIAHKFGNKPYDKNIAPTENKLVSFLMVGEGWHNYHHAFPRDYKAHELPSFFNLTTLFIDLFAIIGWAYDLKQPSKKFVKSVIAKKGDGTHHSHQEILSGDNKNNCN